MRKLQEIEERKRQRELELEQKQKQKEEDDKRQVRHVGVHYFRCLNSYINL